MDTYFPGNATHEEKELYNLLVERISYLENDAKQYADSYAFWQIANGVLNVVQNSSWRVGNVAIQFYARYALPLVKWFIYVSAAPLSNIYHKRTGSLPRGPAPYDLVAQCSKSKLTLSKFAHTEIFQYRKAWEAAVPEIAELITDLYSAIIDYDKREKLRA